MAQPSSVAPEIGPFGSTFAEAELRFSEIALRQTGQPEVASQVTMLTARRGDGLTGQALTDYWQAIDRLDEWRTLPIALNASELLAHFGDGEPQDQLALQHILDEAIARALFAHVWWRARIVAGSIVMPGQLAAVFDQCLDQPTWRALAASAAREGRARGLSRVLGWTLRQQSRVFYSRPAIGSLDGNDCLQDTTRAFLAETTRCATPSDDVDDSGCNIRVGPIDVLLDLGIRRVVFLLDNCDDAILVKPEAARAMLRSLAHMLATQPALSARLYIPLDLTPSLQDIFPDCSTRAVAANRTRAWQLIDAHLSVAGITVASQTFFDTAARSRIQAVIDQGKTLREIFVICRAEFEGMHGTRGSRVEWPATRPPQPGPGRPMPAQSPDEHHPPLAHDDIAGLGAPDADQHYVSR